MRFLQDRPEVDKRYTGLWGGSEGGTVALLAASRSADVSFVVNLAGPVDLFREGQLYALDQAMQGQRVSEDDRAAILALWARYFDDAQDGKISPGTIAKVKQWQEQGLRAYVPADTTAYPPEPSPHVRSFWHLHRHAVLDKLEMPVFMIYGERDALVPAATNSAIIEHVFARTGKSNYDIR